MTEPALRRNRGRSFTDNGNVTSEPSRSCNSDKCIVDFDGSVCHGDACVLKDMEQGYPAKVKPVEDLAALQDWSRLASENGSLPIQKGGSIVDLPTPEVTVLGLDKGESYMSVLAYDHTYSAGLCPLFAEDAWPRLLLYSSILSILDSVRGQLHQFRMVPCGRGTKMLALLVSKSMWQFFVMNMVNGKLLVGSQDPNHPSLTKALYSCTIDQGVCHSAQSNTHHGTHAYPCLGRGASSQR